MHRTVVTIRNIPLWYNLIELQRTRKPANIIPVAFQGKLNLLSLTSSEFWIWTIFSIVQCKSNQTSDQGSIIEFDWYLLATCHIGGHIWTHSFLFEMQTTVSVIWNYASLHVQFSSKYITFCNGSAPRRLSVASIGSCVPMMKPSGCSVEYFNFRSQFFTIVTFTPYSAVTIWRARTDSNSFPCSLIIIALSHVGKKNARRNSFNWLVDGKSLHWFKPLDWSCHSRTTCPPSINTPLILIYPNRWLLNRHYLLLVVTTREFVLLVVIFFGARFCRWFESIYSRFISQHPLYILHGHFCQLLLAFFGAPCASPPPDPSRALILCGNSEIHALHFAPRARRRASQTERQCRVPLDVELRFLCSSLRLRTVLCCRTNHHPQPTAPP